MPKVFDIHPHIASPDTARYPVDPLLGERSDWSAERSIDLAQLMVAMDDAGIEKAAVVHSSSTYGFDNSYVADSVAQQPERLTGVFSVNLFEPDAPEKIAYWHGRGMTGLRIYSRGSKIPKQWMSLDNPDLDPGLRKALELQLSVCINVHAKDDQLEQVHVLLKRYPDLKVVLDHMGRVAVADGAPYNNAGLLFGLAKYPNMYMKITPRIVQDLKAEGSLGTAETFIPKLVSEFGSDRIAFGSNYPSSKGTLAGLVKDMQATLSCLSADDQGAILWKTAASLYPALAAQN